MISPLDPTEHTWRIVEIQRAAYRVEADLMAFDAIPPLYETNEHVAALAYLHWRGAFEGRTLVGIIAWERRGDEIEIDRLAVDPAFSRQGHGRRLIQAVPEARLTKVSTGTANYPALRLYQSLGFIEVGQTEVASGTFTTQLHRLARR